MRVDETDAVTAWTAMLAHIGRTSRFDPSAVADLDPYMERVVTAAAPNEVVAALAECFAAVAGLSGDVDPSAVVALGAGVATTVRQYHDRDERAGVTVAAMGLIHDIAEGQWTEAHAEALAAALRPLRKAESVDEQQSGMRITPTGSGSVQPLGTPPSPPQYVGELPAHRSRASALRLSL